MDNEVTVEVSVKYRQLDGQEKWTEYKPRDAKDVAATEVVREITPFLDVAIGARGKWSAKCNVCGKSNSGLDN